MYVYFYTYFGGNPWSGHESVQAWLETLHPTRRYEDLVVFEDLVIGGEGTTPTKQIEKDARRFFRQHLRTTREGRWLLATYLRSDRMKVYYDRENRHVWIEFIDRVPTRDEQRRGAAQWRLEAWLPSELATKIVELI